MAREPYHVLFLCTGNSARSILAESILNRIGARRFRASSAGSRPRGLVHPFALDLLRALKYPVDGLRSKSWDEFSSLGAGPLDFVVTLCDSAAAEPCPVWPGQPMTAHWSLPDPAAIEGSEPVRRAAFADCHRILHRRLELLVNLPVRALDKMSLRARLEAIGRMQPDAPGADVQTGAD